MDGDVFGESTGGFCGRIVTSDVFELVLEGERMGKLAGAEAERTVVAGMEVVAAASGFGRGRRTPTTGPGLRMTTCCLLGGTLAEGTCCNGTS